MSSASIFRTLTAWPIKPLRWSSSVQNFLSLRHYKMANSLFRLIRYTHIQYGYLEVMSGKTVFLRNHNIHLLQSIICQIYNVTQRDYFYFFLCLIRGSLQTLIVATDHSIDCQLFFFLPCTSSCILLNTIQIITSEQIIFCILRDLKPIKSLIWLIISLLFWIPLE